MAFFKKLFSKSVPVIGSPVAGMCVPITEVSDPTFGHEILGKGVAIRPTDGKVYAPCDATVDMAFETGHAISLLTDYGAEILVHIGLETVSLKGKHFNVHVSTGDIVTKGTLILEFDIDAVAAAGYDTIIPIVVCNSDAFSVIHTFTGKQVVPGDTIIQMDK
jgi:PTS system beta-glucosides-specific IIC component